MNYLAHFLLTMPHEELTVGNFLGDFVKGKKFMDFPQEIAKGILLHRKIDSFTDSNKIVLEATNIFKPNFGRLSPIIVDIGFDYFLAKNFCEFSSISLEEFAENTYTVLNKNRLYLNEPAENTFNYMQKYNWLVNYQFEEGIKKSLQGLENRLSFNNNLALSAEEIFLNKDKLNKLFLAFFPTLQQYCKKTCSEIETNAR
jgi:acyl carrier protein phosphodiesterase